MEVAVFKLVKIYATQIIELLDSVIESHCIEDLPTMINLAASYSDSKIKVTVLYILLQKQPNYVYGCFG